MNHGLSGRRLSRLALLAPILAPLALLAPPAAAQTAGSPAQVTSKWVTQIAPAEPPDIEGCHSNAGDQGKIVKYNIVEPLVQKVPTDGSLKPRLAVSWTQVDPVTWEFKLRQGVKFHDGSPFNAQTAKKSLDRNMVKALTCRDTIKFLSNINPEFIAVDDSTLRIKTERPDPILPMRMTAVALSGPNSPMDKPTLAPVGTGPYIFDSWQPGTQILLRRNESYWGPKPVVEGMRYIWRNESSVRAAMIKLGEADYSYSISESDANDPKMDFPYLNSETAFLRIDMTRKPLDDRRVRLAMNYAVDREGFLGSIMPKTALHAGQMVGPWIPGHNHAIDKMIRPYDPAKAKALIAEARKDGVPVDTEITLFGRPSGYPNATELLEAVMTSYKSIGLNVKMVNLEPGEYAKWNYRPYPENRGPTLLQNLHDNNYGDPVFSVASRYSCNEGNNSTYCDADFDKEMIRVSGLQGEARVKGYEEIFRHLYEDIVPEVWFYHMVETARVNPRIRYRPDNASRAEFRLEEVTFN